MYQKLQTGRATAMAELLSDTIDNVNLNNVAVSSAATPGSGGTVLVDTSLDGAELVTNGDFKATGGELITNGDFSATGSELVTNGDFSTTGSELLSDGASPMMGTWLGTGVIVGGKLKKNGLGITYHTLTYTEGKSYKAIVDVESLDGNTTFWLAGANSAPLVVGINTIYIVAGATAGYGTGINDGYSSGVGSVINSISVKELGEDWTLGTGWSIGDDRAVFTGTSDVAIYQASVTTVNNFYKVSVEVLANEGTAANTIFLGTNEINSTNLSVGVHTFYAQALGNTILYIYGRANDELSITNVTVQEIGEGWNVGTGWSIEEDKATVDTVGTASLSQNSLSVVAGKSYKISGEVSNIVGGSELQIEFSAGNIVGNVTTDGEFTFYGEWGSSTILYLYALGTSQFSVSNVTVKEVGQGWNLNNPPFSVVSNGIASDGTSTADANQVLFPTIGKKYKIIYTIDSISSGGYKIGFGGVVSSFDTTAGTYIRYITAIDDSGYDARLRITPDNSTVGTISYVSVEEFENAGFTLLGVKVGDIVYNTASTPNVATVVGISPDGDTLTLSNDISVTSGVPYKILSRTNSAATLYIGTVGASATLKVRTAGGDDVTLDNLVQGTTLPTQVVRVYNTGTANVSNIIALF